MTSVAPAYAQTYALSTNYSPAGLQALLTLATRYYRRRGQTRAQRSAAYQRVKALRDRLSEADKG